MNQDNMPANILQIGCNVTYFFFHKKVAFTCMYENNLSYQLSQLMELIPMLYGYTWVGGTINQECLTN